MADRIIEAILGSDRAALPRSGPVERFLLRKAGTWRLFSVSLADQGDGVDRVDIEYRGAAAREVEALSEAGDDRDWTIIDVPEHGIAVSLTVTAARNGAAIYEIGKIAFSDPHGRATASIEAAPDDYSLPRMRVVRETAP